MRDDDVTDEQKLQWRRDPTYSQFLCGAWGRRDQSCMFCTPCLVVFATHCTLNPANLEAIVKAKWIMAFLFLRKRHFSVTSQLRHHYVVLCKYWWDILQFFSHTDCQDDWCVPKIMKSCLNLSKLRPKYCRTPFSEHGVEKLLDPAGGVWFLRDASTDPDLWPFIVELLRHSGHRRSVFLSDSVKIPLA